MQGFAGMIGRSGRTSQGSKPGTAGRPGRGYILTSLAVGLVTALAIARADYLIGETVGKACNGRWDVVRWSLMVHACHLSDVNRFDVVNGGFAVLVVLVALLPTLLPLRIALVIPVLMYLGDASRMHATFVSTGRIYPGIELWWLPISWLSILTLLTAVTVAVFRQAKLWLR